MIRTYGIHAVRRLAVPRSPRLSVLQTARGYATPTKPRATPVAAVAEHTYDPSTSVMFNRPKDDEPHQYNSGQMYTRSHTALRLPQPLPSDVSADPLSLQADLYKPTSALDTISLLSICSGRPEFAPRAYSIFTTLLKDVEAGLVPNPEVDAWANVIYGVAQLAKPKEDPIEQRSVELWHHRVSELMGRWEASQGKERGVPALHKDGMLVYSAWLRGLSR